MKRTIEVLLPSFIVDRLAERFRAVAPEIDLHVIPFEPDGVCHTDPAGAEALFRYFPNDRFRGRPFGEAQLRDILSRAPNLRWIQTNASGIDGLLFPELVESAVIVTNGASVNQGPVAESVMALLLAVAKRIPQHARHQERREWQRYQKLELRGSTVAVVGYGHIGTEVGRLCDAFGMRVLAVRRRATEGAPHAAAVFDSAHLHDALAEADFVVLVAASVAGQRPLIGPDELAAMKPTAWLVNVGRGSLIDERAVTAALKQHAIAGAALDVFHQEPLPAESELWDLPNVLVTPHNSGSSPRQDQRTVDLFVENFRRWVAGEPLLNVVDKRRGY